MRLLGTSKPKIAVAALNPHAGEGGLFGSEEKIAIIPAVEMAQKRGLIPAGTFFPASFHVSQEGKRGCRPDCKASCSSSFPS